MFEISTVAFIKNELLTIIMDFGIRSAFSKGQASVFLWKVLVWVRVHFVKYTEKLMRNLDTFEIQKASESRGSNFCITLIEAQ